MKRFFISIAIVLAAASAAFAEKAVQGLYLDQNVQASINPLGLQLGTKLYYRAPLVEKEGILWESTKVDIGLKNDISPAFDFIGAFIDIEPIAVFDLALTAQLAGYYDELGFGFRDLSGYDAGFDSAALNSIPAGKAGGYLLSASPTLKFAFGNFAFLDTLHMDYFNIDGGGGYFYEAIANCPLSKSGLELNNDAYALYKLGPFFMIGLNDSILQVPASGYRAQSVHAVGVYSGSLSERLSLYAGLLAGTFVEGRYLLFEPHLAGQAGVVLRSSP
jgi:hypothetical protein